MSTSLPPRLSVAIPSSRLSLGDDLFLQSTIVPTQDSVTTPSQPTQTSDHRNPDKLSCLHVQRLRLSKRFRSILVSTHLKKPKSKAPHLPVGSDEEQDEPPRIAEPRGRSITSRLPAGMRPISMYDDGQGSYADEFGYIYRSGIDMSISHLDLGSGGVGDSGRASRPSNAADGRVDSRIPRGSLGNEIDRSKDQESRDTGAPNHAPRVLEDEGTDSVHDHYLLEATLAEDDAGTYGMSEDADDGVGIDGSSDGCSCRAAECCCGADDD